MPDGLRRAVGSHVYGCDVCQEVCPWNATPPASGDPAWQPRPAWDMRSVLELSRMTDAELAAAMRDSAMRRTRARGLRRNVALAIDNVQDKEAGTLGG